MHASAQVNDSIIAKRGPELLAFALAIITYANVLPNDYCGDGHAIVRFGKLVQEPGQWLNLWLKDWWWESRDAAPNPDLLYRPTAILSFRIVRHFFGPAPLPQHAVNLLLHAVLSAMIVRLTRRLGASATGALVAGTWFAVMPIHSEVIANIVGRADLLAAGGLVAVLLCHRRVMFAGSTAARVWWTLASASLLFIAMSAKESAATAAVLVPMLDWLWGRDRSAVQPSPQYRVTETIKRLVYLAAPAAAYFALRYAALGGRLHQAAALSKSVNVLVDAPPWQHALGVVQMWGMYWYKTFWPAELALDYSVNAIRLATGVVDRDVLIGLIALFVLGMVLFRSWKARSGAAAVCVIALVLTYLPVSQAFVLLQTTFAERIWYASSIWATVLAGLTFDQLRRHVVRRRLFGTLLVVVMSAMTIRCWIRNAEWRDDGTIYAAGYRTHPNGIGALHAYGQWLGQHGRESEGITLLQRAVEIDAGFTDAYRMLGRIYLRLGDLEASLHAFQIAKMQVPNHQLTHQALEHVRDMMTERSAAELATLKRAAEDDPNDWDAELAVINRLRDLGRLEDALQRFASSEVRWRDHPQWCFEYAVTLVLHSELDAAIDRYRRCVEQDPTLSDAAVQLAMLLLERRGDGDLDEAWRLAVAAEQHAPGNPFVWVCQAELLAHRGEISSAIERYERAIRALPPDSEVRRRCEQRAIVLGRPGTSVGGE